MQLDKSESEQEGSEPTMGEVYRKTPAKLDSGEDSKGTSDDDSCSSYMKGLEKNYKAH